MSIRVAARHACAALLISAALAGCMAPFEFRAEASRVTSASPQDEFAESAALRQRYGAARPSGAPSIRVQSDGMHYTRKVVSSAAWRDEDGIWTVSTVGEETSGVLTIDTVALPEAIRRLTPEESRALDRLLGEASLYRERPRSTGIEGRGSPVHVMEINPEGRAPLTILWTGRLRGRVGEAADIIMGPINPMRLFID